MSLRRFYALFIARNREFLGDRIALGWNLAMPVLIVVGFAFAFSGGGKALFKVGLAGNAGAHSNPSPKLASFLATRHIQFIPVADLPRAIRKVDRHQLDLLLDAANGRYWINGTSTKGYILERLLEPAGLERQALSGAEIRYVDWVVPGVLGMNIMFSALFGVGYVIVRYRKNGVLKRLYATPVSAMEFLAAQVTSRLWLIVLATGLVYAGTDLFVHFRMDGAYWLLLLILILGTLSMIGIGLLIAARLSSEEAANGLLNLIAWPMMLLSGVWFSLEGSPHLVQQAAELLPLTHVLEAARAVMFDGAGLGDVGGHLAILGLFSGATLAIGARIFRWE